MSLTFGIRNNGCLGISITSSVAYLGLTTPANFSFLREMWTVISSRSYCGAICRLQLLPLMPSKQQNREEQVRVICPPALPTEMVESSSLQIFLPTSTSLVQQEEECLVSELEQVSALQRHGRRIGSVNCILDCHPILAKNLQLPCSCSTDAIMHPWSQDFMGQVINKVGIDLL